ncbi:MAG: type II toxin-antitoxin system YafQ family toxin [Kiritimatiellia bacterium]|nr:type II toxin-antitoxin system YafQ family toxin [Kiritimatiellia bacterium]
MKQLFQTTQFSKDAKQMQKRGKDLEKLKVLVRKLANDEPLDPCHRDHPLAGEWKHCRDCHVEPDWILIYTKTNEYLRLERTGTHSDLFE